MLCEAPKSFFGQSAHDQCYLNFVGIQTANFGCREQTYSQTDMDMASVDKTLPRRKCTRR